MRGCNIASLCDGNIINSFSISLTDPQGGRLKFAFCLFFVFAETNFKRRRFGANFTNSASVLQRSCGGIIPRSYDAKLFIIDWFVEEI